MNLQPAGAFGGRHLSSARYRRVFSFFIAQIAVLACLAAAPAIASASTATFTFPLNGATNVKTNTPFSWTAVPGATYYYLYVGTAQGSDNLVNSYALNTTSYQAPELPSGQTLWARIYTDVGSTRTYQDISFTVAPLTTTYFSYPANGSQTVDPGQLFSWYAVPGVTEYDLYIGTTQGGSTLLNTGALTTTAIQVPVLPTGETLWARLWTDTNGSWTHTDISFQAVAPSRAIMAYPLNGESNVNTSHAFTWSPVPGAQYYYLYVGTTQGAVNLAQLLRPVASSTSYTVPPLPTGQTLWARIYTEVNGAWLYQDISFQVSSPRPGSPSLLAGETNFDSRSDLQWAPAPDAQAYYLHVGTTPGRQRRLHLRHDLGDQDLGHGPQPPDRRAAVRQALHGDQRCVDDLHRHAVRQRVRRTERDVSQPASRRCRTST